MIHYRIYPSLSILFLKLSFFLLYIVKLVDMVYLDIEYRYDCAVNIEDLVKLSDVMIQHSLGPNGGK
jgi:GPN-loop GTPase